MLDYLNLEQDLNEEQRRVRDTAREFVENEVKPDIADYYQRGEFPEHLIEDMGELGFYAPNIEGYGLPGVDEKSYGLVMQELEAGDSGMRSMASVQGSLVMYPIHAYGSEEQKERYLPALGRGEMVGCFGLTEPEHGSEPSAMETTARKEGDEYVLNGAKTWITNSPIADVALVWARDEGGEGDVRGFLVPTETDGFEANRMKDKLSMRASITGEIHLDGARVPDDGVLPGVEGMGGPLSCLTQGRYGVSWGRRGCGARLLRRSPRVRKGTRAVGETHRRLPASAGKDSRDGDAGHQGTASGAQGRRTQGKRRPAPTARLYVETQQRPDCAACSTHGTRDDRRKRCHSGLLTDAAPLEHRVRLYLRGYPRRTLAHTRCRHNRRTGFRRVARTAIAPRGRR
jgi:Acyl-CoA dehydrogenases